ncbi:uncharacterized protein PF11_0207-like [Lingula anatina]|uniref:Uncharacterized protein PF11_0207-like n=1 Tax=Lingula anatina TaxID=7574 RepID=A0A2R2MNQ2_LINAN|nr:uncharacterized protein PF11_0207-like [Lingula anatina]|eukprot:XP_023931848.1 uncharacterized protein PF11_0207-like [Lingula anatina]
MDLTENITVDELRSIQATLAEIKSEMIRKSDVKEIIAQMKHEIKQEVKEDIKQEMQQYLTDRLSLLSEKIDALYLDNESLREKLSKQISDTRKSLANLKETSHLAKTAVKMANYNQQYSQKNNIKFLNWPEKPKEDLRRDLCRILKEKVNVDISPASILGIHRIPGNSGGARPVIAKFVNTKEKTKVIKHRQALKGNFIMFDHITQKNAELIKILKGKEAVHSAWYFNARIFAIRNDGRRYTFDIFDDIDTKLKQ